MTKTEQILQYKIRAFAQLLRSYSQGAPTIERAREYDTRLREFSETFKEFLGGDLI